MRVPERLAGAPGNTASGAPNAAAA